IPFMGGAVGRVGAKDTAFGDRSAPFMVSIDGNWWDPAEEKQVISWVRDCFSDMKRFSTGQAYLNFTGKEESDKDAIVRSAYGDNYARLQELKKKYDPQNFFRLNQNIEPAS
ncbi:MAG TPA: BBE domain-containing protein, partial [Actinomycetota bacterium]|nr:BBE domain-containing protein [Actinomycetota bacterium]